jgi:Uma2 family endonuclease
MAMPEMTAIQSSPKHMKMSYEEFLVWASEDVHAEWVDGEVIVHMPPKDIHQATLGFLHLLLQLFVHLLDLGRVRIAPFEVILPPGHSAREPDIFFVARDHLARLTQERLVGPPDLIIEIISDDSVQRDRRDKFREYRVAGVPEYWIIDPRPTKQRADFFRLDASGEYELFATEDDTQVASHVLPGFWLQPAWLWQADTLDPLTLFFTMRGIPEEQSEHIRQLLRSGSQASVPEEKR